MRSIVLMLTLASLGACDVENQAPVDPQLLRAAERGDLTPPQEATSVTDQEVAIALDLARRADAVFAGEVVAIEYQVSEPDDAGRRFPFTYVTWYVEDGIKGVEDGETFTARFLGGPMGERTLVVTEYPVFAEGERDLMFVANNGEVGCPLVAGAHGRVPIAAPPADGEAAGPRSQAWYDELAGRLLEDIVDDGERAPSVALGTPFVFQGPQAPSRARREAAAADFRSRIDAMAPPTREESDADRAERAALIDNNFNPVLPSE